MTAPTQPRITSLANSRNIDMTDPNKLSLKYRMHAAMTAQFSQTKRAWSWVIVVSLGAFVLSMVSIFISSTGGIAAINFLSLVVGLALVFMRVHAQSLYGHAEALRRAHRQLESHGIRPRDAVIAALPSSVKGLKLGVVSPDRRYYGSSEAPGSERLAENLEESAFYTRALARRTWQLCAVIITMGALVILGLLYAGTVVGSSAPTLMRILPHISSAFVLGFAMDLGFSFARLENVATETFDRIETIRKNDSLRIEDLIPAITDYDCALAATGAAIPDAIYARMEPELGAGWEALRASRNSQSGPFRSASFDRMNAATAPVPVTTALRALLFRIFDDLELRWFVEELNDIELKACLLGSDAGLAAVVDRLVAALDRRGLINADLFAALTRTRPLSKAAIQDVAHLVSP